MSLVGSIVGIKGYLITGGVSLLIGAAGATYATHRIEQAFAAEKELKAKQAEVVAEEVIRQNQIAADDITFNIGVANAKARANIGNHTKTVIRDVPHYLPAEIDLTFGVPCGFFRVLDAAASGLSETAVSEPTCGSDGQATGVSLARIAIAISDNYGEYRQAKKSVEDWQDWYSEQKARWEK